VSPGQADKRQPGGTGFDLGFLWFGAAVQTKGELKDFACPHNARIEAALESAKKELQESKTK
jgi:hypothetical protein